MCVGVCVSVRVCAIKKGELEVYCFIRHLNPQSVNVTSELEALHFQRSAAGCVELLLGCLKVKSCCTEC